MEGCLNVPVNTPVPSSLHACYTVSTMLANTSPHPAERVACALCLARYGHSRVSLPCFTSVTHCMLILESSPTLVTITHPLYGH